MAEEARLESVYTSKAYPGFESRSLRRMTGIQKPIGRIPVSPQDDKRKREPQGSLFLFVVFLLNYFLLNLSCSFPMKAACLPF